MKKFQIIFFLLAISVIQIYPQISEEEYKKQKESLLTKKSELNNSISLLKNKIDSLTSLIPQVEQQIADCYRELYTSKYGEEIGQRVIYKQVWKGMTENMMMDSWGTPDKIDKNKEKWGVFSQWYYGDVIFFFRDGKLIDWEEGPEGEKDDSEFYLNKKK
ncbi:MAG TPA: hypothetical protein VH917_03305 [Ignavibacteriaceae bacterium]